MSVHAAMAGGGNGYYSWRERQGMSGGRLPACVAGRPAGRHDRDGSE